MTLHTMPSTILLLVLSLAAGAFAVDLNGPWKFALDKKDVGQNPDAHWAAPDFDDSDWKQINVPGAWENQGYAGYNGIAWYRRKVVVPESFRGQTVLLALPAIDETDDTFFNGVRIGGMKSAFLTPRVYRIDESLLKFGQENVIAVRVGDFYGNGGMSRGSAMLMVRQPLAPEATEPAEPLELNLADVSRWKHGWRDGGTSDTRPRLHSRPGAFAGRDALGLECWFPNSEEYIEHVFDPSANGSVWNQRRLQYLSFWCRGVGASGDMKVLLSNGPFRWQVRRTVWEASFFVEDGQWRRVVLPFSAFVRRGVTRTPEPMDDMQKIAAMSIGYANNALRAAGEVQFADFRVGSFAATTAFPSIALDVLWELSTGRDDPSPTWARWGADWKLQPQLKEAHEAWFRHTFQLPAGWSGLPLDLSLGKFASETATVEAWINDQSVGASRPKYLARFRIDPALLKPGLNSITLRVRDDRLGGRTSVGPYTLTPDLCQVGLRDRARGKEAPAEGYQHDARPGRLLDVIFNLPEVVPVRPGWRLSYELVDCFHRPIRMGEAAVDGRRAVVPLSEAESWQLYQSEILTFRGVLVGEQGEPQAAFADPALQMRYDARDMLALPELPETFEDTPYGRLRLIDEIDAATDSEHPYKEGGIRASWVGRRAYSTWIRGVTVNEFQGRKYREANNNEFFGYRVGRGRIKPHTAYVLRVEYPEDKTRYMVMNIDASRNYQGTGFKTGAAPNDPFDPYPLSGRYEWCDHFVFPDDTTYGWRGSRTAPGEYGFWVFFHDNGRLYTPQYQAGPAVARIKLYEITDVDAAMPRITPPEGRPRRMLIADWEREPEAAPDDTVRYAMLMGWNAISPETLKWGNLAYYRSRMQVRLVKPVRDPLPEGETPAYDQYLAATRAAGLTIIPRLEYGGTDAIPKDQRAVGPNGKPAAPNRFHTWCADLLEPVTLQEMSQLFEEVVGERIADNPQIGGVQWRIRSDRLPISYSDRALKLFADETGRQTDRESVATGPLKKAYEDWWHAKRRDFHVKLRDQLRRYRPDLKLYYYNWDPDGWNLGRPGLPSSPADWTMYYNVHTARQFYDAKVAEWWANKPDFLALFLSGARQKNYGGRAHHVLRTELYRDVDGVALLGPLHWNYLADDPAYVNYFRTGDGLAMANIFNYEEKGRSNVQGDNYESSEMTPGGPTFAMAEEILACFHGDPTTFTTTTYTFGRAFAAEHRRFAQAFLALPATLGTVLSTEGDVRVRQYDGGYVGVVSKSYEPKRVTVRLQGSYTRVTDLVTGKAIPTQPTDGGIAFEVTVGAMSLNAYRAE